MTYETKPQPETAQAAIDELGITMSTEFVPYSQSRNYKPSPKLNDLSLNWKVTIKVKDREILTTDYGAGFGHCPAAARVHFIKPTADSVNAVRNECETGLQMGTPGLRKPILPKITDVLSCLVSDADAIDHPTFEDWASDLGYDTDSRKAEQTYRACLETALKLRAGLGDDGFRKLREAFQDF